MWDTFNDSINITSNKKIEIGSCIAMSLMAVSVMLVLGEVRNWYVANKHYHLE